MDLLALKRSLMPMSGPQDMGGGGGGSGTGTQTNISELPEWARGYAKNALEKTAALSEKPYQAYEGPRISGFSPMQLQSQQAAANMTPSAATGAGIDIAGAAALGGLGQNYQGGQFYGGQFGGRQAAQYMSPFIQEALAPQLREAQRASDIMGQQNAAKAVGQGAFGGSRSALVEAERQRNLGIQQGDILSKGYQTAYEQAANQFNQDAARRMQAQQLGEQSRQFGANLGLQGLNTALQGASQLGALGGQQFQQGMDINKLQNAYGGQQQALRQQGLDMAYQDFLNEQNYPYKQLGFMSDMIRGLPLGQQSTQTMYQAPGSLAGQIGGLGVGALGLSKFMAEGGLAYAGGGSVDDPDNVERIVSKLSDAQLQQAMKSAQARGDADQLEAIQTELAMRASERGGMAGAFNQLPQQTQETFTAANGGIVAFADGSKSTVGEDAAREQLKSDREALLSGLESLGAAGKDVFTMPARATAGILNSGAIRLARAVSGYDIPYIFGSNPEYTESMTPFMDKIRARNAAATKETPAAKGEDYDWSAFDKATDEYMASRSKGSEKAKVSPEVFSGLTKLSKDTGVPATSLMDEFTKMRDMLKADNKGDMDTLNRMIEKSAGRSQEIRDKGLGKALAEYGFQWAAAASRPGARFMGSAAQASPYLAASAARTDELARAAEDNHQKLGIAMKQFEIAQRKGDNATALGWATQVRMLQQADKQLELKRAELAQTGGYQQNLLDIHRQDLARKEKADEIRGISAVAQQEAAKARMAGEMRKATLDFETNLGSRLRKQLEEQYGPMTPGSKSEYLYKQQRNAYVGDALQVAKDRRADAVGPVNSLADALSGNLGVSE